MGHVLHALGQKIAEFLSAAAHEALAVTKKTVRERIQNPSAYLMEQAKNLVDSYKQATLLALQFGTYTTQDLETMLVHDLRTSGAAGSSGETEHALRSYFNPTGIMLNDVVKSLTPAQTGTLLGNLLGTVAVNKASKALFNKALSSVSKSAQTFANAMHDNAGKKLADQHGKKSINKTINALRKEPEKLSASKDVVKEVEKTAAAFARAEEIARTLGKKIAPEVLLTLEKLPAESLSKKVFEEFWLKDKMPKINWWHIFVGETKKGKLKGFHYERSYPEKIVKNLEGPNSLGIRRVEVAAKRNYSDLFPKGWDRAKIAEKIKEAYKNIIDVDKDGFGFIGKTKEGMNIQFWVIEENGLLKINSIYPKFK